MNVAVITSQHRGFASLVLPALHGSGHVHVDVVVLADQHVTPRPARFRRHLRKVRRIGVVGALNGLRMRPWYDRNTAERLGLKSISDLAQEFCIPLVRADGANSGTTITTLERSNADLGLALGVGLLEPSVFRIPSMGTLNVHHEILPDRPGAQSVLWAVYDGSLRSGYTIHQVDEGLDSGPILFREIHKVHLHGTLKATVIANHAGIWRASVRGLLTVLEDYPSPAPSALTQLRRPFTTPSARQFLRIVRQHRRLRRGMGTSRPRD